MSFSMFSSKTAVNNNNNNNNMMMTAVASSSTVSPTSATASGYSAEPLPTFDPLMENGNSLSSSLPSPALSLSTSSTSIRNKQSYISSFYHDHCFYLIPMIGWFTFSALLSCYNKLVFGQHGTIQFPCPLFMTSIHFLAQWAVSDVLCRIWPVYFGTNRVRRDMDWREWASISIPCGLVTSGDVGLSNLSMVTISLTFYTMVKASTPIFVLFWAYLFGIERITWTLIFVVLIIAFGEYLTCLGEDKETFQWHGFILCLCASILSGARWTLVQVKLQSLEPPLKTTVVTMRLLAPSMFFSLLLISMAIERPWIKLADDSMLQAVETLALGLLGAFFAINMVLFEFYLIMHASAIILMIGGVLKEMLTIVVGVVFFKDPINATNMSGCFVVFLGVVLYKISFHLDKAEKNKKKHHHHHIPKRGTTALERDDDDIMGSNSSRHGTTTSPSVNATHNGGGPGTPTKRSLPNREWLPVTSDLQDHSERTKLVHSLSKSSDMNGGGLEQGTGGLPPGVPSLSSLSSALLSTMPSGVSSSSFRHQQQQQTRAAAKEEWIPSYDRKHQQDSGIEMRRSSSGDDRSLDFD